jgi:predicted MFS family arabinose efflux permease
MEGEIKKTATEITDYIFTKPEVLWVIVVIGSIAVIGVVDFSKCFIKNKQAVKWIVFFVSLIIAIVLSPLVPPLITMIVILWLLILAVSTIARNAIVDGLPSIISRVMGNMGNLAAKTEERK